MQQRFAEIDALKAVGILTVVLIHSVRAPFDPGISELEIWLGHVTRFAVPAFLVSSGFLYAGVPATPSRTLSRLRRILVPYLFASLLAQLWWAAQGEQTETGHWPLDLLLGSSLGPYYYVFVIVGLVLVTPLFARLGAGARVATLIALTAAQWWVDAASGMLTSFFWHLRNPLLWWAYFAAGWIVRDQHAAVTAWLAPRRRVVLVTGLAVALSLSAVSGLDAPRLLVRSAAWANIWVLCALIFATATGVSRAPRALCALSDATYPIYLLHMFFVLAMSDLVPPPTRSFAILPVLLPWLAGVLGSFALIAGLKTALGKHSKDWIGA